jgi:hypothetical protein
MSKIGQYILDTAAFVTGARVAVKHKRNVWYAGVVTKVSRDGTYVVTYNDGDEHDGVGEAYMQNVGAGARRKEHYTDAEIEALTLPPDEYLEQKKIYDELNSEVEKTSKAFRAFLDKHPRGKMNLTPDNVKKMPEFIKLKGAYDKAAAASKRFNLLFTSKYRKELTRDRDAKREAKLRGE